MEEGRGHEPLEHTADVGLRAWARDLPALFEEAALALAELTADIEGPAGQGTHEETVQLEARDLPGLAYSWLNELLGLAEIAHAVPARAIVETLADDPEGWRLRAHVSLLAYASGAARPRIGVKSATYHGLEVERSPSGDWRLSAYLDV